MTLTNLATVYGPNLLHPGNLETGVFNMDVVTPVSVVLYYLNCPEEFFEIPEPSPENTASPKATEVRRRSNTSGVDGDDRVVLRDRDRDRIGGDASSLAVSQKFKRGSRRASTKGTPKHSSAAGNAPVRSATSVKSSSSSSSVSSFTPSRESII